MRLVHLGKIKRGRGSAATEMMDESSEFNGCVGLPRPLEGVANGAEI
jgi:hypothetical protein